MSAPNGNGGRSRGRLGGRRDSPGAFSLVELMIVVVSSSVVLAGFLGMYTASVSMERRASQDLELRYLAIFSQDRVLSKLREASAIVRVRDTAFGPVLVYERVPVVIPTGGDAGIEDLGAEPSCTGVIYRSGRSLYMRERRPIREAGRRLIASSDLASETSANEGASSRETVSGFLSAAVSSLPDTREELVSPEVFAFELGDRCVTLGLEAGVGTSRFGATFRLSHVRPPAAL
ncbi:MAG: hypothetical protein HYY25_13555 [Candidatus Wallbacteria bacterium]|nr:hypothetical protein [Candidatus Wallbacteria bacterium]